MSKATSRSQYWSRSWTAAEKMLAPVLDPLDRPSQEEGRRCQCDLFRVHDELGAEAAADVGRDHTQLIFVKPQQHHQEGTHLVGELRRRPQSQPVLVDVVDRNCAAPFDRMCATAMLLELHAGAAGSARERVGDVAIRLPELGQENRRRGRNGRAVRPGRGLAGSPTPPKAAGSRRQRAPRRPRRCSASARSPPPPPRRQRRPRPWQGRVALYRAGVAPYETGAEAAPVRAAAPDRRA